MSGSDFFFLFFFPKNRVGTIASWLRPDEKEFGSPYLCFLLLQWDVKKLCFEYDTEPYYQALDIKVNLFFFFFFTSQETSK